MFYLPLGRSSTVVSKCCYPRPFLPLVEHHHLAYGFISSFCYTLRYSWWWYATSSLPSSLIASTSVCFLIFHSETPHYSPRQSFLFSPLFFISTYQNLPFYPSLSCLKPTFYIHTTEQSVQSSSLFTSYFLAEIFVIYLYCYLTLPALALTASLSCRVCADTHHKITLSQHCRKPNLYNYLGGSVSQKWVGLNADAFVPAVGKIIFNLIWFHSISNFIEKRWQPASVLHA